jgi:hypothetical protein
MPTNHKYHGVGLEGCDMASIEAEESLISEKDDWTLKRRQSSIARVCTKVISSWSIVNTLLSVVIIVLLVEPRWHTWKDERTYKLGDDLTGFTPRS